MGQAGAQFRPRSTFNVIGNAATRVAALLSGDVDMIYTVPPQDMDRIGRPRASRSGGPELRTIFLGFDQTRAELLEPTSRARTRSRTSACAQAFYQAIDDQGDPAAR